MADPIALVVLAAVVVALVFAVRLACALVLPDRHWLCALFNGLDLGTNRPERWYPHAERPDRRLEPRLPTRPREGLFRRA